MYHMIQLYNWPQVRYYQGTSISEWLFLPLRYSSTPVTTENIMTMIISCENNNNETGGICLGCPVLHCSVQVGTQNAASPPTSTYVYVPSMYLFVMGSGTIDWVFRSTPEYVNTAVKSRGC